jgi:hypothetical protein
VGDSFFYPLNQLFNGLRLIPLGFEWRNDFEVGHKMDTGRLILDTGYRIPALRRWTFSLNRKGGSPTAPAFPF